jgi:hypothetical protein
MLRQSHHVEIEKIRGFRWQQQEKHSLGSDFRQVHLYVRSADYSFMLDTQFILQSEIEQKHSVQHMLLPTEFQENPINIYRWESFIGSHLAASNSIAAFSTSRTKLSLISNTTSSLSSSKENCTDSLAEFFPMGSRSRALPLASLQWPSSSSGIGTALSLAARQAARSQQPNQLN